MPTGDFLCSKCGAWANNYSCSDKRYLVFVPEGKTVIGTCGDCKYLDGVDCDFISFIGTSRVPKDFGCIYWKEKTE